VRRSRGESGNSLVELVVIVAVALGLALGIQAFLVKPYRIPSESMVPTLEIGQRVLVNRIGARFSAPDIGDVTVFHPPARRSERASRAAGRPHRARMSTSSSASSPAPAIASRSTTVT
jgi:signal peptidase I